MRKSLKITLGEYELHDADLHLMREALINLLLLLSAILIAVIIVGITVL